MTIMHFTSVICASITTVSGFSPTITGRTTTATTDTSNVVVLADGSSSGSGSQSASADSAIWLIKTSTDCFIRVGCEGSATIENFDWFNSSGTPAAADDPISNTGNTIFQLNELPDSVRIYTYHQATGTGTPSYSAIGTYTDANNEGAFFNPTQDVRYGKRCDTSAVDTTANEIEVVEEGWYNMQFTFRKSGYDDYTIYFKGQAISQADRVI